MPKRAGQSFDLVVAAVTIGCMGVTPPPHPLPHKKEKGLEVGVDVV